MAKRASKSTIEILDEESVRGVFFRVAERGAKPLTEIPVHLLPLVKAALERADEIETEWIENKPIF